MPTWKRIGIGIGIGIGNHATTIATITIIILSISTILTIITTTVTSQVLASGPPAHCTRPHVLPMAALGGGCDHPHLRHEEAEVAEQTRSAAPPTHLPAPLLPRG